MRLILALILKATCQLQDQQSHNAPDLIIAEHRQRVAELTSMLPGNVQSGLSKYLQQTKKGKDMSAEDVLAISSSLVLSHIKPTVLALGYVQSSETDSRSASL